MKCVFLTLLFAWFVFVTAEPSRAQQSAARVVRKDYDMRKLVTPPPLTENELKGRRLFVQRCAICHDSTGQGDVVGKWLDQQTVKAFEERQLHEIIATGSRQMPGFQYSLQPTQIDQIVAFLKTVTPDQRPK